MLIGWVIAGLVGAVLTSAIIKYWDEIKDWLNNVAADFVEQHLGYNARQKMLKAIVKADRVANKIRNTSVIYTRRSRLDNYLDKTTIIAEQDVYEVNQEVLDEIAQKGELIQEYEYRQ